MRIMATRLNQKQLQAVNFGKGPLLLLAGAGTGKTKVICDRIIKLVKDGKALPSEILALTFTEKASEEMRIRVEESLPISVQLPWILTFHAFGERVLEESGLEVGLDLSAKLLTESERWLFLRERLFDFDLKYFRPLGNPGKFISAILTFFSRAQDEDVTPERFVEYATSQAKGISASGGELLQEENEEEVVARLCGERLLELASLYSAFEKLKLAEGKRDFGDLIVLSLKLLRERPNVLKKYQNQFKYILVDEFQDTNYSQYQLIKLLAPANLYPSLTICADDDQSIYKFRGASVSNVLQFKDDYKSAKVIVLTKNYRSVQPILDKAYQLIRNNDPDRLEVRLGVNKKLRFSGGKKVKAKGKEPTVEMLFCASGEDEAEKVVSKIISLKNKNRYRWKDFAILARANSHFDSFISELRRRDVPFQLFSNRGLFDQLEIRELIAGMKVLASPNDSIPLFQWLSSANLKFPQETLLKLLRRSHKEHVSLWSLLKLETDTSSIKVANLIEKASSNITVKPVSRLYYDYLIDCGFLSAYLADSDIPEEQRKIRNINLFFEKVRNFESQSKNPNLFEYLNHLALLIEAGENPSQSLVEDVDTVNLLTVHSAKGLEFKVVFLVQLIEGRFPTRFRGDSIPFPEELIAETLPSGDAHLSEERRLFYVGITRAREKLIFSLARNYGGIRDSRLSLFLKEIGFSTPPLAPSTSLSNNKPMVPKEDARKETQPTDLREVSYSQLETFEQCPLKYKYHYVLGLTGQPTHSLAYGQTIHRTLRDFHHQEMSGETPCLSDLLKIYESNFLNDGYLSQAHKENRFKEGLRILKSYYENYHSVFGTPFFLERRFRIRLDKNTILTGSIDRVDKGVKGDYEIIDYKTGEEKSQKEVNKNPQLQIYALAFFDQFGVVPDKLSLYFIEKNTKYSTTTSIDKLQEKKEELLRTISKIRDSDFKAKPNKIICRYCEYNRLCPFFKVGW